jgi:hypothetical protein
MVGGKIDARSVLCQSLKIRVKIFNARVVTILSGGLVIRAISKNCGFNSALNSTRTTFC